jgi:uncharacterized protein (TIGR03790 family)
MGYWSLYHRMLIQVTAILSLWLVLPVEHLACAALEPAEVLVIANGSVSDSVKLAKYYMEKRGIPSSNLLKLRVPDKESCSRENYDQLVAKPVRRWLEKHQDEGGPLVRCLVMMYGMPLRVLSTAMSRDEKKHYTNLTKERTKAWESLQTVPKGEEKYLLLERNLKEINKELGSLSHHSELSALDSELALVDAGDYLLGGWQLNPSYLGYRGRKVKTMVSISYMVARLDGPDPETVKRIIDDSIDAEKNGLTGKAYFDARWPQPDKEKSKTLEGYNYYDNSLYQAAELVQTSEVMDAVINSKSQLFQPGECPDAALYSGWYRRANYYDAFDWQTGAVGYHIASSECGTLKSKNAKGWCLGMLRDGVAAVIGPIDEPYVQAFPPPALFFSLLIDGRYSLAESFAQSVPFRSWRMVLVGDPLYRPFKNRQVKSELTD